MEYVSHWQRNMLPPLLNGFAPEDIYNLDETGVFFKCLPGTTLSFKGEKCHGGKYNKDRLTVIPICNMSGTHKLRLIVIGKFAKPRGFKDAGVLPVDYYNNQKAWMTTVLFNQILIKMDNEFRADGRSVLLFVDNCPSHGLLPTTNLQAIKIEYLPPNFTSHLQPLDAGIIKNIKHYYRKATLRDHIRSMRENNELKKINVLDAIYTLANVWHNDVKPETIANCFRHAGFGKYQLNSGNTDAQEDQWSDQTMDGSEENDVNGLLAEYVSAYHLVCNGNVDDEALNYYMDIDADICGNAPDASSETDGNIPMNTTDTSELVVQAASCSVPCASNSNGPVVETVPCGGALSTQAGPSQFPPLNDGFYSDEYAIARVIELIRDSTEIPPYMKEIHIAGISTLLNK